jgi:cellulose synthase/poly-beta-1,6-N-acetylglucosamine synthase-like glycosyltransferase
MSAIEVVRGAIDGLEIIAILFFIALNGWYLVLLVSSALEMRQDRRLHAGESSRRLLASPFAPRISVIAPAYNEQDTIAESLRALFGLHYPNIEVVLTNDGSKDRTLEVLQKEFDLVPIHCIYRRTVATAKVRGLYRTRMFPNLIVVDKENGGRADALNAGLNVATGDLVCVIDADTLIDPDAMVQMVRPFLDREDVLGVGGTIRIANGCEVDAGRVVRTRVPRHPVAGIQVVEYLRAFLFGRLGWNRVGGNLIISGAFGMFRRETLLEVGGFAHDSIGEDFELVMRLRTRACEKGGPNRIVYVPEPVGWTEAPSSLAVLGRQRDRWHRGLADTTQRYRRVLFNPRYGIMGMVVFPHYAILEMFAPVVEGLGLIGLAAAAVIGILNTRFAILFFLAAYGFGTGLTLFTLVLEELTFRRYGSMRDRGLLVLWTLLENLGYRQLTVFWRLRGLWKFMRGDTAWGNMQRQGFLTAERPASGLIPGNGRVAS